MTTTNLKAQKALHGLFHQKITELSLYSRKCENSQVNNILQSLTVKTTKVERC